MYGMCELVLHWFRTAAGVAEERHADLIDAAIGGRFASWVEPDRTIIGDVAEQLAVDITAARHA
jgi:hypothetical protein